MSVELIHIVLQGRLRLKCDSTRAETRFRLSAKRTSPFKSAGASVQSTTGSRGVRIGSSNAGYTMFRGSVKGRLRLKCDGTLAETQISCFGEKGRVHLNWRGCRFSQLPAAEVRASAVVILDTPCSEVV